jgi:hypothetical protein
MFFTNFTILFQLAVVISPALSSPVILPWFSTLKIRSTSDSSISESFSSKINARTGVLPQVRSISDGYYHTRATVAMNASANVVLRDLDSTSLFDSRDIASGVLSMHHSYDDALQHSNNLQSYAAEARTGQPADGFSDESLYELQQYHTALYSFQSVFAQLGGDKGLANYDRENDVETLLKNMVNLHKYTLNYVDCMVADIPTLGPILAPVLYDIKCILDLILNSVENLSDAFINALQPLLRGIIGATMDSTCQHGAELLGLCI